MRTTILALILLTFGCSSPVKRPPQADLTNKTPVASAKPSVSQKMIYKRLQDGQEVVGKTEVEGARVR